MHIRLPITIALTWALTALSNPSQTPQEAAGAVFQLENLHDALEARGRIPINPLPHPEGTAPCGTYLPEATDGPCGAWWLAAHPGYHRTTTTEIMVATVTATLTPPVVVETETRTAGG
ncbi:MAG: hypothetical protein L6R37_006717 [Teloschistes peruensis]|nr:MAG: hypothetical protein L6R37_006717 [Teloschistes peruensis]